MHLWPLQVTVSGLSGPLILSQRRDRVAQRNAASSQQRQCPTCPDTYEAVCNYGTSWVRLPFRNTAITRSDTQ